MKSYHPFNDPNVENVFFQFGDDIRDAQLQLRELIFEIASETPGVGPIEETLKWGQPAYLTPKTKSGSTIRLGVSKRLDFAIFTHCQTTIMSDFQTIFPDEFEYEGNRAIHFKVEQALPMDKLALLIKSALTYHLK